MYFYVINERYSVIIPVDKCKKRYYSDSISMSDKKVNTHPEPPMKAEGLRILARLIAIKHLNTLNKKYHQKSGKDRNENLP